MYVKITTIIDKLLPVADKVFRYSLMNMRQLQSPHFIQFSQNLTCDCSGKFVVKHKNQQTITCQVLAELNKIWSCLILIKL